MANNSLLWKIEQNKLETSKNISYYFCNHLPEPRLSNRDYDESSCAFVLLESAISGKWEEGKSETAQK